MLPTLRPSRRAVVALLLVLGGALTAPAAASATVHLWIDDGGLGRGSIEVRLGEDEDASSGVRVLLERDGDVIADQGDNSRFGGPGGVTLRLDPLPGDLLSVHLPPEATTPVATYLWAPRSA